MKDKAGKQTTNMPAFTEQERNFSIRFFFCVPRFFFYFLPRVHHARYVAVA